MQDPKLPFSAIHGDPDITSPNRTRFGPTAKVLPWLERGRLSTIPAFLRSFNFDHNVLITLFKLLSDPHILQYIVKNIIYDIPLIGKYAFMEWTEKIMPSIGYSDLEFAKGYGGIRPQLIDKSERELMMGEAKLVEDNVIFNMTPSPGASVCLDNARKDVKTMVEFLDDDIEFQEDRFRNDFSLN